MKILTRTLIVAAVMALMAGCASNGKSGTYHTADNVFGTSSQCVKAESKPYQRNYLTQHEKRTGMVSRSYSPSACTYGNPRYDRRAMNSTEKSATAQRAQIAQMALGGAAMGALVNHNDRGQGALVGAGIGALAGVAIQ